MRSCEIVDNKNVWSLALVVTAGVSLHLLLYSHYSSLWETTIKLIPNSFSDFDQTKLSLQANCLAQSHLFLQIWYATLRAGVNNSGWYRFTTWRPDQLLKLCCSLLTLKYIARKIYFIFSVEILFGWNILYCSGGVGSASQVLTVQSPISSQVWQSKGESIFSFSTSLSSRRKLKSVTWSLWLTPDSPPQCLTKY